MSITKYFKHMRRWNPLFPSNVHSAFFLLKGDKVQMEESQKFPPCLTSKYHLTSKSDFQQCHWTPQRQTLLRKAESHGLQLLTALRSFRERNLMFDFTITVEGHNFPCHRCVLAACSDFFRYYIPWQLCGNFSCIVLSCIYRFCFINFDVYLQGP